MALAGSRASRMRVRYGATVILLGRNEKLRRVAQHIAADEQHVLQPQWFTLIY